MAIDLEKLEDSPHLLDLLIKMEDVLDTLDVYVFKNWFSGEVVEGPKVRRYWLDMTLKYPYEKMPDPRAGLRLLKHGVRVDFEKVRIEDETEIPVGNEDGNVSPLGNGREDGATKDGKTDKDEQGELFWMVRVSIPRRLIVEINAGTLDFYDEEIDAEDIQDANDSGISDETGYVDSDAATIDTDIDTDAVEPTR